MKRAVRSRELFFTPDTEKYEKEKLKVARKLLDLFVADTPAESVRSISRINREVNSCIRGSDDSIQKYVRRFVSKDQAYLNIVDEGADSAESDKFAM